MFSSYVALPAEGDVVKVNFLLGVSVAVLSEVGDMIYSVGVQVFVAVSF